MSTQELTSLISREEKEFYAKGIGVIIASGSESGGRIAEISETASDICILFHYLGTDSGLLNKIIQFNYEVKVPKIGLDLKRIDGNLIMKECSNNSVLVLSGNPRKIIAKVWPENV